MGGVGLGNQSTDGILVSRIVENGPASQPGKLQLHDRILKVNGQDLTHCSHREAVDAIKTAAEPISILICRKKENVSIPPYVPTEEKGTQTDKVSNLSRSISLCALPTSEELASMCHTIRQGRVQSFDTDTLRRTAFSVQRMDDCLLGPYVGGMSKFTELVSDTDSQYHSLPRQFKCRTDTTAFENAKNLDSQLSMKRNRNSQIVDGRLHKREEEEWNNNDDDGYNGPLNTSKYTHILTSSFDIFSLAGESVDNYPESDSKMPVSMVKVKIEGNHDKDINNSEFPIVTGVDQVYYDPELGYEYEDITLHCLGNKLGLTLSSGGEDEPYAVFVDEVDPQSIAGIDGRLLEGDQILKINEYPIYTLDEAVGVLENCGTRLKLLVARPATNEIQATFLSSEVDFEEVNGQTWCSDALQSNSIPEEDEDSLERMNGDKVEKDSGVGRTDESAKTSEGSEHDISIEETQAEHEKRENRLDALGREILKLSEGTLDVKMNGKSREQLKHSDKDSNKSFKSSDESRTSWRSSKGKKEPIFPRPEGKEVFIDGPNVHREPVKEKTKDKNESKKDRSRSKEKRKHSESKQSDRKSDAHASRDSEIEWKGKIAKDGTVYIRKKVRPSRNRLLRERASKLAEERKGMTTDDDTHTIYMGKYWSKEDRKKHLGKVREAKQRKCQQLQQIAEKSESGSEGNRQIDIVEMSHRKMSSKQKFDDFVTVEEILTQRNRGGARGPVLVTTV